MDLIDRQAAIDTLNVGAELLRRVLDADIVGVVERAKYEWGLELIESYISDMKELPSAQPEVLAHGEGELSAQADHVACYLDGPCEYQNNKIELPSSQPELKELSEWKADFKGYINALIMPKDDYNGIMEYIDEVPSAQPERTCVNCGRTVNNGGWYADGRTRCPIEEHYALPKDGYCHLWEKRNVTDDDYPERRTDGSD